MQTDTTTIALALAVAVGSVKVLEVAIRLIAKMWGARFNNKVKPTTGEIDPLGTKLDQLIKLGETSNNLAAGQTDLLKDHSRDHQSMAGAMGRVETRLSDQQQTITGAMARIEAKLNREPSRGD